MMIALKTLFGYTSQPSLESVLAYAIYYAIYCLLAFWGVRWWLERRTAAPVQVAH